jgi:sec-independent protein translocase protein TatA
MNIMFAAFGIGGWEVVLILAVVLVLFGARKLPELAKGLGQGIKEFKKATREVTDEIQNAAHTDDSYSALPPKERQIEPSLKSLPENPPPEKMASVPHSSDHQA